jgi:hypothetical protein
VHGTWTAGLGREVGHREDEAPERPLAADETTSRERAALAFLEELGSDAGPRVLAHDDALGFVVLEDLGNGFALLDTIQVAVDASRTSGALRALGAWFEEMIAALRGRWPHLPPAQDFYPAYRQTG